MNAPIDLRQAVRKDFEIATAPLPGTRHYKEQYPG